MRKPSHMLNSGNGAAAAATNLRPLGWIFGSSPNGACSTENRQDDARAEIALIPPASGIL